ncbi:lipid IV(A) 3-deoxy-D-manno-octulosonic acid transferase [Aliidiomarina celeris]|uniref:lipid IV(A) 3-deoxy-D-manno-octulosonic acid transferase n=1 Tax=Aliidiomarina celeris TaxID=2249428 RepID=UPI000DEA4151|nr:lipid IV(A) 3-deoxy-D-manno-octulosonic acid transferase [Aliidiomarina celeris]
MVQFFARLGYSIVWYLALPFALVSLYWQSRKNPAYRRRWRERFGFVTTLAQRPVVIHCASVGEFMAAKPLITAFLKSNTAVHITTNTPTGSALIQSAFPAASHSYIPLDTPSFSARFVKRINPRAIVLLETEVWPNLVSCAKRNSIPVCLLNARMSARSAAGYEKARAIFAKTWQQLSYVGAQDAKIAARFEQLGVPAAHIEVAGNLKFDVQVPSATKADVASMQKLLAERQVITAGSTHDGEEVLILDAFEKLLTCKPNALLILVPRHKERFERVANLIEQRGLHMVKRSSGRPILPQTQVLLADSMGEMLLWYGLATVAFIGGSLIERGGHNPLEAMAFGVPITSGRHVFNFEEVFQQLDQLQAVRWLNDAEGMHDTWLGLLTTPETAQRIGAQAQHLFARHRGATARMHSAVQQLI